MSGPSERDEIAAVLAAHRPGGLTTALNEAWVECSCDERVPVPVLHLSVSWENAYVAHEQHVSGALTDLLAERDRRTAAKTLREAANWMNSAEFKQPEASRYINESHWDDTIVDACDALELRALRIEADQ